MQRSRLFRKEVPGENRVWRQDRVVFGGLGPRVGKEEVPSSNLGVGSITLLRPLLSNIARATWHRVPRPRPRPRPRPPPHLGDGGDAAGMALRTTPPGDGSRPTTRCSSARSGWRPNATWAANEMGRTSSSPRAPWHPWPAACASCLRAASPWPSGTPRGQGASQDPTPRAPRTPGRLGRCSATCSSGIRIAGHTSGPDRESPYRLDQSQAGTHPDARIRPKPPSYLGPIRPGREEVRLDRSPAPCNR